MLDLKVPVSITSQQIADVMTCAVEGGISYWACAFHPLAGSTKTSHWYADPAFWDDPNFRVRVVEIEESRDDHDVNWVFGMPELLCAFQVLPTLELGMDVLMDIVNDNQDATTGDVIVQLCAFGEMVYC